MLYKESKNMNEPIEKVEEPKENDVPILLTANVANCERVNIRTEPAIKPGNIICEATAGSELLIDPTKSTDEWCYVYLEIGATGYCMRKYITYNE